MARLTSKARDKLESSQFALAGKKYPIENAAHARNAKARAEQQFQKGNLSAHDKATVDRKADAKLRSKAK
jgi:hypothetical protein